MVTRGLHIVGYPTLTGLLCNSVPITSFTAQRMPQARCSLPSAAVQLHGLKYIVQTVPFGCETPCPREHLMVVMRAALCVYPCFLFLLWALRYLRIKDSEMPRKRLWSTTHLESPGSVEPRIPCHIFSTAHQWVLNQVTAMYPTCIPLPVVALVISWYLLCHLKVPWRLCPQVFKSEIPNKTVRWLRMTQWAGSWSRSLSRGLCYTSGSWTRVNERLDSAGSIDQRSLLSWICSLL